MICLILVASSGSCGSNSHSTGILVIAAIILGIVFYRKERLIQIVLTSNQSIVFIREQT